MHWIDAELEANGLQGTGPSMERVRIFSAAFGQVMDMLPSYRPFLLALQKEYDGLIERLRAEFDAAAPLEGRMMTMKAESLSFVGESMTWFQMEINVLRRRLEEVEGERDVLQRDYESLHHDIGAHRESSERNKFLAAESHQANLDILRHLERCEKQVEMLRKQEKEVHSQCKELERKAKESQNRIATVEDQLGEEREKLKRMVPKEECDALREDIRHWEAKYQEMTEQKYRIHKDYLNIVETYTKKTGQTLNAKDEMRPLTPRPMWRHCRGLLDPEAPHSLEKADVAQDLLAHMLSCSRTLLSAYGLAVASQKSTVFQKHAKHPVTVLVGSEDAEAMLRHRSAMLGEDALDDRLTLIQATTTTAGATRSGGRGSVMPKPAAELISDDSWLPPDLLQETPPCLRRNERTRNLWFSRKKVADFIDGVLQTRSRQGASACSTPFAQHMLRGLKEEMGEGCTHEATEFGANVYAAVKRYSSEPDFLAYFLLLQGKLPDTAVRDSKAMCPELLRIFTSHFGSGDDGLNNITKQKFYHGLREFLQNKDEKMWKELVTYFPAGGPDVLVNFEWLLLDDLYVLSPVVFALRLQHLEEVLTLVERLEQVVHAAADARRKVKYEDIKAAFADDNELSFLHEEDYAKAFETSVAELTPGSEQDAGRFIDLVRAGDILRGLFFPILPSDDADAPAADVG